MKQIGNCALTFFLGGIFIILVEGIFTPSIYGIAEGVVGGICVSIFILSQLKINTVERK